MTLTHKQKKHIQLAMLPYLKDAKEMKRKLTQQEGAIRSRQNDFENLKNMIPMIQERARIRIESLEKKLEEFVGLIQYHEEKLEYMKGLFNPKKKKKAQSKKKEA